MTLPNQAAGLATIGLEFAFTNDGSIPGAIDRTQDAITEILKGQVFESQGWQGAHEVMFSGLPQGVPYTLGLLMKLAQMLTGLPIESWGAPTLDKITQVFTAIGTFMARLTSMFKALDFLQGGTWDPDAMIEQWLQGDILSTGLFASWAELYESLTGDLTGNLPKLSDLLGGGLFGPVAPGRLSLLPTGLIGDLSPNLLEDPDFKSETFDGGGVFIQDKTTGFDGSFSARVVADGAGSKDMLSKNKLDVTKGQKFFISIYAKWSGAVATGTPVHLGITEYNGTASVGQPDIVLRAATPATTDFVQLVGEYTVPETNVNGIRLRFGLAPAATAGTFWFSKGELRPTRKMPTDLVDGLDDSLQELYTGLNDALDGLLEKVGLGDFNDLKNVLGGTLGSGLTAIEERLNDFLHTSSPLNGSNILDGDISDQFVGGVRSILTNIFTKLRNVEDPGSTEVTRDDAFATLESLADATTSLGARIATLETVYTSGISTGDDFERSSSSGLGPNWLTYYKGSGAGVIAIPNGHDASWVVNGFGDREFLAIWNGDNTRSASPNQRVLLPMAAAAGSFFGALGATDVWLRISDDTTGWANVTGIQIRFWADGGLEIIRWVGGNPTVLNAGGAGYIPAPGPGHIIGGEAGAPGVGRYFNAILGSNGVLNIPEVGTASGYGAAFQRWGWGGRADGHLLPLPGQQKPGSIRQWTAMDQ